MKERRDPLGPIQSDKHTLSAVPAYLQKEDELWEPLDGPHHKAVECDSVWTGILAQLQERTNDKLRASGGSAWLRPCGTELAWRTGLLHLS